MPGYFGIYRGRIADNMDPVGQRRVKVMLPAISSDMTSWASICAPFGGAGGALPVGAAVWVMFEGGDVNFPVVMGMNPSG